MEKVTTTRLRQMKQEGMKITMLTCYDYPTSCLMNEVGIDVLLVGDSLGMVVLGYEDTLPVTMADVIRHTQAVARGNKNCLLVADMPFMSYEADIGEAVRNAGRLVKEGMAHAVKPEGGRRIAPTIDAIVKAGIPVLGHIGLTPQSVHQLGGFGLQAKTMPQIEGLLDDAKALDEVGAFAIVLECIPQEVAKLITDRVSIPTIGIGAGAHCDGQVLVTHDILGLFERLRPKFVKKYADLMPLMKEALVKFKREVTSEKFPGPEHSFRLKEGELKNLKRLNNRDEDYQDN
jgi:3-methyl-2-oxobutanoate hydroxymethyltransferase